MIRITRILITSDHPCDFTDSLPMYDRMLYHIMYISVISLCVFFRRRLRIKISKF